MELTPEQITSFQKLYKEELGIEITEVEALEKGSALIQFLNLEVPQISTVQDK